MEREGFLLWVFVGGKEAECKRRSPATEFQGESSLWSLLGKGTGKGERGSLAIL